MKVGFSLVSLKKMMEEAEVDCDANAEEISIEHVGICKIIRSTLKIYTNGASTILYIHC